MFAKIDRNLLVKNLDKYTQLELAKQINMKKKDSVYELKDVIQTSHGMNLFIHFSYKENSLENLLCFYECVKYSRVQRPNN